MVGIPEVNWEIDGVGMAKIRLTIENSTIHAECEVPQWEEKYMGVIYKHALAYTRTCIDLVAFSTGMALTPAFTALVRPGKEPEAISLNNPTLGQQCTAYKMDGETHTEMLQFGKVLELVIAEPPLMLALNDLVTGISNTDVALINCGRVLDGLRKIVAPNVDAKRGWPVLQAIVNCAPGYLESVSNHSILPRHGDRSPQAGVTLGVSLHRTWAVLNRFIEYRKRGNEPLPHSEFPILTV